MNTSSKGVGRGVLKSRTWKRINAYRGAIEKNYNPVEIGHYQFFLEKFFEVSC